MRYRLMATYRGVPYHAGLGPDGNEATLFSPAPPPGELGFTAAGGHWHKQVGLTDLDALWQSRLAGEYRGEPCLVLDDLGDRLHIAYRGRDPVRARQLGYWEIDREVFEVVVARRDITGLTEERVDHPLDAAMFPASQRDPAAGGPQAAGGASTAERTRPLQMAPQPTAEPDGRRSSTLDRMAAWHGSPEAEPWPGPQPQPQPRPEPRTGPQPRLEPRTGPQSRLDPRTGPQSRLEPRTGPQPRLDPRTDPRAPARPDPRDPWRAPAGRREAPGPWAAPPAPSAQPPGRRAGRRDRVPQSLFAELLSLAAIPHAAYAVDEEVPGAMCLVKADGGFEVFSRTDDARLDVRFFEDEEAAYFYLFGVLAAEAVRSGRLRPGPLNGHVNGSRGPGVASPSGAENVSKYLRRKKLPKPVPHAVIVN